MHSPALGRKGSASPRPISARLIQRRSTQLRFVWNALQLSLPVLFTVVRRAPILMAAIEMRGFQRQPGRRFPRINVGDLAFVGSGVLVFGLALADRLGRLPSLGSLVGLS